MTGPSGDDSDSNGGRRHNGKYLEWLLDYELRSAARYRRFVSLMMVTPKNGAVNVDDVIKDYVRSSDEYFELDGVAAILMGETDAREAMKAADRYQRMCSGDVDLRFAVASYPADARAAADLLSTVHQRLAAARGGERRTIGSE